MPASKDEFKLQQTANEIQDLLNLLTKNNVLKNYMLVSDGNHKVKFVPAIHTTMGNTYFLIDEDNAININLNSLKADLNIPNADQFVSAEYASDKLATKEYVINLVSSAIEDALNEEY